MNRREFFASIIPFVALKSGETQQDYSVPARWIQQYRLQPVREGVPDNRIVCRGEDGQLYRLTDVLRILFSRHNVRRNQ